MILRFVFLILLSLMFSIELVHTRHHKVHKKPEYSKGKDGHNHSRASLLWDLILIRKTSPPHKGKSRSWLLKGEKQQKKQLTQRQIYQSNRLAIHNVPIRLGLCNDQHPMCAAYALNGRCDWPGPFQTIENIHRTCAFSCGYCNESIPGGEVDLVGAGWDHE